MIILSASIGLAGCTSFDFPKRGFATRYFAGSYVQKSVTTTSDFTGQPFHPAIETYSAPVPPNNITGRGSSTLARNLSTCETVARQRATDIAFQGFGDATQ